MDIQQTLAKFITICYNINTKERLAIYQSPLGNGNYNGCHDTNLLTMNEILNLKS